MAVGVVGVPLANLLVAVRVVLPAVVAVRLGLPAVALRAVGLPAVVAAVHLGLQAVALRAVILPAVVAAFKIRLLPVQNLRPAPLLLVLILPEVKLGEGLGVDRLINRQLPQPQ